MNVHSFHSFKKLMGGLLIAFSIGLYPSATISADQIGINKLRSTAAQQVDQLARGVTQCDKLNIGVVFGANTVYTKSYGANTSVGTIYSWASVSKPLTALIAMHLVEQGRLDLDTPVWVYTPAQFDYQTMIPNAYESPNPLTLRRLLRHTGGVVHSGNVRKPSMYFQAPDVGVKYATNGYGIVGDMLWGVEAEYPTMVQNYIAGPIQATTLQAKSFSADQVGSKFITPGAYVQSNIKDFSRFAVGIMNNEFVSQSTLNVMLDTTYMMQQYGENRGLGFHAQGDGDDKMTYHSGSNGTSKAHFYIKPFQRFSVTAFCKANSTWVDPANPSIPTQHVLYNLSVDIENTLNSFGNPCLNSNDCIYQPSNATPTATSSPTATPTPGAATTTVEVRVNLSKDDSEERISDGKVGLSSPNLNLIRDGTDDQIVGLRFPNVAIPPGATITEAFVEFETYKTGSNATSLTIQGEAADNAPAFVGCTASCYNLSNRAKTGTAVAWNNIPAWTTVDEKHQTPNLALIVQEIVNRSGWSSGNALVFLITGSGTRVAKSYNGQASAAPLLHLTYTLIPTATNTATNTPTLEPPPVTSTPSNTATPAPSPTPTATSVPTDTPTPDQPPTATPTATSTSTDTPTPEPATATSVPTDTPTPDQPPTATPTATSTSADTPTLEPPTATPTATSTPTSVP